nr:MAG TPA: 3' exoribonuclease [Caudoviricetes sp.]
MENTANVHFMLDLETLDTKPSAHILELALICFCPFTGRVNEALSRHVRFGLSRQAGATISPSTMQWWVETNEQYFNELLTYVCESDQKLQNILFDLDLLMSEIRVQGSDVRVWNTGSFDVDIINDAARRVLGKNSPMFNFWEVRDVRSLHQLNDDFGLNNDEWPTSHNAKDDYLRQISYVHSVYGALSERGTTSSGNSGGHSNVPTAEEHTADASTRQSTGITGQ